MKAQKIFGVVVILALLFALVPAMGVSAAAVKVDVCHLDKDAGVFFLINISDNAFDSHVAHGDAAPGELVPGSTEQRFTEDCSIINREVLVDTIIVPSGGSTVTSTAVLTSGVNYELEASGTYTFVNWANAGIADARCSLRIPGSYNSTGAINWIDGNVFPVGKYKYLQVWVNAAPVEWGTACSPTHIYTSSFSGLGAPLSLRILDDGYGDNSGWITVKIYYYNW